MEFRPLAYEGLTLRRPSIFLAGPIQGAPKWQSEATRYIARYAQADICIFNPRVKNKMDHSYDQQAEWEKLHLGYCRNNGAIIFWFAAQDANISYPTGRAYAQTTRIEFGRALGWRDNNPEVRIHLGIDPNYLGGNEKYLRHSANEIGIDVHDNLPNICQAAVKSLSD